MARILSEEDMAEAYARIDAVSVVRNFFLIFFHSKGVGVRGVRVCSSPGTMSNRITQTHHRCTSMLQSAHEARLDNNTTDAAS
jgi:hypothetical protein